MNQKSLLGTAVVAALLFGAQAASACAISAWSAVNTTGVVAGDAGEPQNGWSRYSGRCSLRIANSNGANGRFVQDDTPSNEPTYRARFYYFTGDLTGTAAIFQARKTDGTPVIQVTHNGSVLSFTTLNGGAAQTVPVADSRYYAIEIAWAAGAGTGSMTASVTGSGNPTPVNIAGFSNLANSADSITDVRLGLINGSVTTGAAPVYFDEFDSRRTTNPGRLCRGDANGNGTLTGGDAQAVINEFVNNATTVIGQPDCGENGTVTGGDAQCIITLFTSGGTCG